MAQYNSQFTGAQVDNAVTKSQAIPSATDITTTVNAIKDVQYTQEGNVLRAKTVSGSKVAVWEAGGGAAGDALAAALTVTPAQINEAVGAVENYGEATVDDVLTVKQTGGTSYLTWSPIPAPSADNFDSDSALAGQTLVADGSGGASWQTPSASGMTNPMTTQGDIIIGGSSGTPTRLAKGTAGQVLTMNSGATSPEWATPSSTVYVGDISPETQSGGSLAAIGSVPIINNNYDVVWGNQTIGASNVTSGIATSGQVLTANGSGGASWQTPSASGMTNPMTTQGDIIIGGSSGTPTRLAKGTAGQVLTMNSGATSPEWATPSSTVYVGDISPETQSGGSLAAIGSVPIINNNYDVVWGNQTIGASNVTSGIATSGQVLTANGSGGASWQTPSASGMTNPMTTQGDIIIGGSSGTPTRLAKGTAGQVLTMNSGATEPEWQTPSGGGGGVSIGVGHTLSFASYSFGEFKFTAQILATYNGVYGLHTFTYSASGGDGVIDGVTIPYENRNDAVFTNASIIIFTAVGSHHDDSLSNYAFKLYDGTQVTDTNAINKLAFMTEDVEIYTID